MRGVSEEKGGKVKGTGKGWGVRIVSEEKGEKIKRDGEGMGK